MAAPPPEIIANPTLPSTKSDRAKRPYALFKISNEPTPVPVVATHYKTQTDLYHTPLCSANSEKRKTKRFDRGRVSRRGLFGYCVLRDDYFSEDKEKYPAYDHL